MSEITPTSIVMGNRLVFPPEVTLGTDASAANVALRTEKDGSLTLRQTGQSAEQDGFSARKVVNGRLGLQKPELEDLGWRPGEVVEFVTTAQGVTVRAIDPKTHAGFIAPETGEDGLPIPPNWLVQAFTSNPNVASGLAAGRRTVELVNRFSQTYGRPLDKGQTVLDFGCGAGRVLRYFPQLTGVDVVGCDLHEGAIEWCRRHFPFGTFLQGTPQPPIDLPDDSIDLLLAVSVLTHLDESLERAWLAEWKRILKPGALAVVTYHGAGLIDANIPADSPMRDWIAQEWEDRGGIAFLDNKAWKGVFPDEYQTTYHREDYLRRVWGEHFDILDLLPSGNFTNKQDVAILRA